MDVVIAGAVGDEQLPFQPVGSLDGRGFLIALFVNVVRQTDVSLGVDRIVEMPIGDRGAGEGDLVGLGRFEDGMQGHVSTVAPAPNTKTIGIHVRLMAEPHSAVTLIGKFLSAETIVDGFFEKMTATRGTTIVQSKNNE